ncbi:hypothetical protein [Glycomyces tenuis]|uniref:hypothetical protein n=1 Tax=Glycomyces tenuis TaxID=58116 RepID=UPI000425CB00|nr:hypothetical protein [Glycomyces tenuis]
MRTQFTGVEQGSAIRDEINSDGSACAACPVVQYKEGKLSGDTAVAAVPLTEVVGTLDVFEMGVALYASDAPTHLLEQDLTINEVETLACQGVTNYGLKRVKLLGALQKWGGLEYRQFQTDRARETAAANAVFYNSDWNDSGRGLDLDHPDTGELVSMLCEAVA